jgi:hypothetical protein
MDLSALDTKKASNAGAKIELKHPVTQQGLGNYIHILGKDSDAFRAWVTAKINADRLKQFQNARKKEAAPTTAEEDEEQSIRLLVACMTGFSCDPVKSKDGFSTVEEGGEFLRMPGNVKLSYSEENAAQLLRDFPEVLRQVNAGIADLENFMKG